MRAAASLLTFLVLAGCAHIPRVSIPNASAVAPQDPGTPGKVGSEKSVTSLPVAAGSTVEVTQSPKKNEAGEEIAQPVVKTTLSKSSELKIVSERHDASTGTIDTKIATHRIDTEARGPLLYASMLAAVVAGLLFWLKYPMPSICAGAAAIVFFAAWEVAALPAWFWALGVAAIAIGAGIYFGHERGEKFAAAAASAKTP